MQTQKELARRLRLARANAGINQHVVASELGLPRPTISQIEAGKRGVSSIELVKLAKLYGRPMESFFEENFDQATTDDPFTVLYRAVKLEPKDREVVEQFEQLCRSYRELENLFDLQSEIALPDYSVYGEPRNKIEAIRQGEQVASEERRRLGIGDDPIRNVFELVESQGVKLFVKQLYGSGISGLFMYDRRIGPCILINGMDHRNRLSFNAAHEYAHVLLDRKLTARISTTSQQIGEPDSPQRLGTGKHEEFLEVRANSFAAAFLMPAAGIERFLWDRGMTRRTKNSLDVVHVIYLQYSFGVSYAAALYRLQNLGWIDQARRAELAQFRTEDMARALGLQHKEENLESGPYPMRYVYLTLEAFRQNKIGIEKVAKLLNKKLLEAQKLVKNLGISPPAIQAR
jgi:Zn-dependent peptidase ImmA (M78 family)/DNA-binding XRE family transcriptional regulator